MGRPRILVTASVAAFWLLAVSLLGRCDAKRTLKVVSILVSDSLRLYRVTRQVSDLGWVDIDLVCSSSCLGSR